MEKKEKVVKIIVLLAMLINFVFFIVFTIKKNSFFSFQFLMFFFSMLVPLIIKKVINIKISMTMIVIYIVFLIMHFVLGEIMNFYVTFNYYDTILHFLTSFMISYFTYELIEQKGKIDKSIKVLISFMMAISCEFFWEIFEFTIDEFFKTNMQRFIKDGIILSGHLAIRDTIKDMVIASLGTFTFLLYYYLIIKKSGNNSTLNK